MGDLRWMWRLAVRLTKLITWTAATTWLGATTLLRAGWRFPQLRLLFVETLPCPRGHETPAYGVFTCACGALHEGWVFGRCRVCGLSAGWTPCVECGLPVRDPRLA